MKNNLANKKCIPCEGDIKPMTKSQAEKLMKEIPEWTLDASAKKIAKEFVFKNFMKALDFIQWVADIAETEGHHPDIFISYNKVTLTLFTHAVGGLSENDFIVAAKIDEIPKF